jgi:prophage regulatory protein
MKNLNILKEKAACQKIGKSRSSFWDSQNPKSKRFDRTMPKKVKCGARSVGWLEHELDLWLEQQAAKREVAANAQAGVPVTTAAIPTGAANQAIDAGKEHQHDN